MSKSKYLVSLVVAYIVSLGIAYAFTPAPDNSPLISPSPDNTSTGIIAIDPSEPRDQPCPLNGVNYTKTEKKVWDTRRPMAVMVENHLDSRPQSGLSRADVVYEAIAEGGITRFMGVFYCDAAADIQIGPVRSARTYFLDLATEYGKYPVYVHVGGANTPNKANALGQIEDYGWVGENDLNQFALGVKECWRDYTRLGRTVATEHTMYCSTDNLWKAAGRRGWNAIGEKNQLWSDDYIPWKFGEYSPSSKAQSAEKVAFEFWDEFTQYAVTWDYDSATKTYKRSTAGQPHPDKNTDKQLEATTVIVQYVTETGPIDELKHMLYGMIGGGKATIYTKGKAENLTWSKKNRMDRTIFKDSAGKEFQFPSGKIWVEIVPKGTTVSAT